MSREGDPRTVVLLALGLILLCPSSAGAGGGEVENRPPVPGVAGNKQESSGKTGPLSLELEGPLTVARAAVAATPFHIGDSIGFLLKVHLAPQVQVGDPLLLGDSEEFVLRQVGTRSASAAPGGGQIVEIPLEVTALAVGDLEFPGVELPWSSADGRSGKVSSQAVALQVVGRVKDPEQATPADIRAPAALEFHGLPGWFYGFIVTVLMAALLYGWWRWRHRTPAVPVPPPDPFGGQTPAAWALMALERMEKDDLLGRDGAATFHVRLAGIIRRYLAGQFGVDALERTTAEIMMEVEKRIRPLPGPRRRLREVLGGCDLVKFARFQPPPAEALALLEAAKRFILETEPEVMEASA